MCTQKEIDDKLEQVQNLIEEDMANGRHIKKKIEKILKEHGSCPEKFAEEIESCGVDKNINGKG